MTDPWLDPATRATLIDNLIQKLHDHYVFPEVAQQMDAAIRAKAGSGAYDELMMLEELCERLTADLQAVSHDKHLRLFYHSESVPEDEPERPTPEQLEEFRYAMSLLNFGFARVERLPGNVGYLDLRGFCPASVGGEAAVAAMNLLARTGALIVDLRQNGGGDPEMIALITSYLFDQMTNLNNMYWRDGDRTQQFWTLPYVPGRRYGAGKPVYVLTSSHTFSGAEEFAYNLKNLKRATIVGEVTGGGAHPVGSFAITPHVGAHIPVGRAVNPISGTNWEGTGVTPDIAVPQEDALRTAQILALRYVLEQAGDHGAGPLADLVEEARAALAELEVQEGARDVSSMA
ncbi:MAG TPA: S41 family peptidase [Roseiflexaceae bacterium]|nr:S41 family peptidase [Roseiflexaceae bacterium]